MKNVMTCLAAALMLGACLKPGGTEGEGEGIIVEPKMDDLYVHIVDSTGADFVADTVYWSTEPDPDTATTLKSAQGTATGKKGALRLNGMGTRWLIGGLNPHGMIYVRARYERSDSIAPGVCKNSGYQQIKASAEGLPRSVDLTLRVRRYCD
jgi:hypothetical protein